MRNIEALTVITHSSVKRIKEAKQRVEEEKQKELLELEKLKIEAAQPAVDASTLFYTVSWMFL